MIPHKIIAINTVNKVGVANNCNNSAKQKKAVLTKNPLKKIENPVGASTCTFVSQ